MRRTARTGRNTARKMEKFADYRNYLTFSMYEQVIDENGMEKKELRRRHGGRGLGRRGSEPEIRRPACGICHAVYAAEQPGIPRSASCSLTKRSPRWIKSEGRGLPAVCEGTGTPAHCLRAGRASPVPDPKCGQCVRIPPV